MTQLSGNEQARYNVGPDHGMLSESAVLEGIRSGKITRQCWVTKGGAIFGSNVPLGNFSQFATVLNETERVAKQAETKKAALAAPASNARLSIRDADKLVGEFLPDQARYM